MATLVECFQLVMEETPRFEGAANATPTRLSTTSRFVPVQAVGGSPNPSWLDRSDEVRGINGAPAQLIDGYKPAGQLTTRAYVNDLIFLLPLAGFVGVATPGDGVIVDPDGATIPATATRWVYTKRGGQTAKTAQLTRAYTRNSVFIRDQGAGITSMTVGANGSVQASLASLVYGRIADPNLVPVYDSLAIPNLRAGDFAMANWLAAAGTADDFNFTIASALNPYRGISQASYFDREMQMGDDPVRVTGSRPARTLAAADIDALLSGATFAAKGSWKSPKVIAATAYKYSMWVEMPACQYIGGGPDDLANKKRFGGNYDWFAAWDDVAGYDAKITLVGAVTAAQFETLV